MLGGLNHLQITAKRQSPAHAGGDTSVLSTAQLLLTGSISAVGAR